MCIGVVNACHTRTLSFSPSLSLSLSLSLTHTHTHIHTLSLPHTPLSNVNHHHRSIHACIYQNGLSTVFTHKHRHTQACIVVLGPYLSCYAIVTLLRQLESAVCVTHGWSSPICRLAPLKQTFPKTAYLCPLHYRLGRPTSHSAHSHTHHSEILL